MSVRMSATELLDYLNKYYKVITTGNENEVRINCPFCEDDTKGHLYINIDKGLFHCFRGDHKINIAAFLAKTEDIPYAEAWERVKKNGAVQIDLHQNLREVLTRRLSPVLIENNSLDEVSPPEFYIPLSKAGVSSDISAYKNYVLNRGITEDQIKLHQLGACPFGPYHHRVIMPIIMYNKWVGYQGRDITNTSITKVVGNRGFPRAQCLFNYDLAKTYSEVVVVEGAFGAMHVGPNAVATCGKKISKKQIQLLEEWDRIVLLLDANAHKEAIEYGKEFKNPNTFVVLLPGGQPDSFPKERIQEFIKNAEPIHSAKIFKHWMKLNVDKGCEY